MGRAPRCNYTVTTCCVKTRDVAGRYSSMLNILASAYKRLNRSSPSESREGNVQKSRKRPIRQADHRLDCSAPGHSGLPHPADAQ